MPIPVGIPVIPVIGAPLLLGKDATMSEQCIEWLRLSLLLSSSSTHNNIYGVLLVVFVHQYRQGKLLLPLIIVYISTMVMAIFFKIGFVLTDPFMTESL